MTSQTPTIRFALPSGTATAQFELCPNRTCATPTYIANLGAGPATVLPKPLSAGVAFWRLRGVDASGRAGTTPGPVWEMFVGARSAVANTSWGTTLDLNGDGLADLAVGAPGAFRAYVFPGAACGLPSTTPGTILSDAAGCSSFGSSIRSAGDVNGDGFADLIAGSGQNSTAYVFDGSPVGVHTTADVIITGAPCTGFATTVSAAGDVNGDGFADVLVGEPAASQVLLYAGGASGLSTTPSSVLSGPSGSSFGASIAGAGDVNADGYSDVVIGAPMNAGYAYVYYGSATGLGLATPTTLPPPIASKSFGQSVALVDDDGDGFTDVVVAAPGAAAAYVFKGSASGAGTAPLATLTGSAAAGFGAAITGEDFNGDGFGDLAVSAPAGGMVYIFAGSAAGTVATPAATLSAPSGASGFGDAISRTGDVNGDHLPDLVIGAPNSATTYLYLGASSGLGLTPAMTFAGPGSSSFGASVE